MNCHAVSKTLHIYIAREIFTCEDLDQIEIVLYRVISKPLRNAMSMS